ncbi:cell surface protein [Bacillus pseudomycoides]|uniref:LPXTG cell wall anchor domain-containing protein n=1 Tax=Bacillus TaxID=1386 RepID=UPI0001A15156|nr:LPXTG cell wall anchor domain-containing protein [Bacillus pseudomycoides]EEM03522.1 cell wall surface anchor [Bacillus pseudomycoides]EEM09100.1 cell wall surface anchor [Bacillus pseudomycoides]MCR8857446.1 LPXTG cell wall anchor domain-containing protein [Bacillus pseudomycoides]MED1620435.1 LPXTG cell wall anchor domain-containing protein [Bacillus pseudomycoides]PDZ73615.1 cell surface protein [Bacillus pseudomycoides]
MKKKLLPICAMALLSVGYSSVASASTGTMTKEEVAQVQQDTTKKEAAMQEQQKQDKMKKEAAVQEQQKQDKMKKEAVVQEQQKQDQMKKEAAVQATKGEKLPNTASNSITMMTLSACLVALGSLFGFTRRKIKA